MHSYFYDKKITNNWYTRETQPIDPFVLEGLPLFTIIPSEDRDHTDSRRIKPNSRTLLIGEQPNPSKLLPPEDRMSRHRIFILIIFLASDFAFLTNFCKQYVNQYS